MKLDKKFVVASLLGVSVLGVFSVLMNARVHKRFDPNWGRHSMVKFVNSIEWSWYDFKMSARKPEKAHGIVVAAIDDKSLDRFGRWPWSRSVYKKILGALYSLGAEVVGFDAVFSEPEFQKDNILENFTVVPPGKSQSLINELKFKPDDLMALAESLPVVGDSIFGSGVKANQKTVLGYFWQAEGACEVLDPLSPEGRKRLQITSDEEAAKFDIRMAKTFGLFHVDEFLTNIQAVQNQRIESSLAIDQKLRMPAFECAFANRDGIGANALYQGFFNAVTDNDGIFRRMPLVSAFDPKFIPKRERQLNEDGSAAGFVDAPMFTNRVFFPSLALQSLVSFWNPVSKASSAKPTMKTKVGRGGFVAIESVTIPREGLEPLVVPTLDDGSLAINFYGSQSPEAPWHRSVAQISLGSLVPPEECTKEVIDQSRCKGYMEMLQNELQFPEFREAFKLGNWKDGPLKGQIILIGPTALGVYDLRPNPVQGDAAGVFLHATAVGRILERAQNADSKLSFDFASPVLSQIILWLLGVLLIVLLARANALKGALYAGAVIVIFVLADIYIVFAHKLLVLETLTTTLAAFGVSLSILGYKYFTEEKDRAFVKGAFEKYVSPDVVSSILQDPKKLNLGGQKKTLSVMFSDIRGFTTISERMGAAELAKFMNDYLSPMTDIVLKHRGTIDKYMGDAIMAIFGAPIEYDNHAEKAADAALEMMSKLEELKANWKALGLPAVDIGIGINTGEMSVGNMGSTRIFSYTVMGDSVNLGSRLEGINKEYGTHIIVSEFTRAVLGPDFICRQLDRVKVKGKKLPVSIFEVMGKGNDAEKRQLAQKFEAALELYFAQKFLEAQVLFTGLADKDPTSAIYVERCGMWMQEAPEAGWDGSWTMKTK
jgi:adenylate cyclase